MKARILVLSVVLILALGYVPAPAGGCKPIKSKTNAPDDPIDLITSALVIGDCVHVTVQAGGGCERHRLHMTWDGNVIETFRMTGKRVRNAVRP